MEKGDLTYRINECAMKAHTKLERGFLEYVYCRALAIELRRAGIAFQREVWLPIYYDQYKIAARRVDFLCENQVTIEAKAKNALDDVDMSQALNTLGQLNIKEGLLLNFGAKSLEFRHLFNRRYQPNKIAEDITPELVLESVFLESGFWEFLRIYVFENFCSWRKNKAQVRGISKIPF